MLLRRSLTLALCLTAVIAVSACGKKKPTPTPAPAPPPATKPENPPPPPAPPTPAPTESRVPTEEELFAKMTLDELNAKKPLAPVMFTYDSATISEEGRGVLAKNLEWMKKWSSTKVTVEGHCDNRGTPEYNLALGDKRAAAVKTYLLSLGLAADRIATVSKGEEQPFCKEDNDACWAQNRVGYFVITAK
jgi:peptidoglycan-associated lipoprotein